MADNTKIKKLDELITKFHITLTNGDLKIVGRKPTKTDIIALKNNKQKIIARINNNKKYTTRINTPRYISLKKTNKTITNPLSNAGKSHQPTPIYILQSGGYISLIDLRDNNYLKIGENKGWARYQKMVDY